MHTGMKHAHGWCEQYVYMWVVEHHLSIYQNLPPAIVLCARAQKCGARFVCVCTSLCTCVNPTFPPPPSLNPPNHTTHLRNTFPVQHTLLGGLQKLRNHTQPYPPTHQPTNQQNPPWPQNRAQQWQHQGHCCFVDVVGWCAFVCVHL